MLLVKEMGSIFGFHESDVKEVMGLSNITRIPHQPKYMKGVCNYKNTVVPVICLRSLLGENSDEKARIGVVLEMQEGKLIIMVSELLKLADMTMVNTVKNYQELKAGNELVIKNIYEDNEPVFELDMEATFENLAL